MTMSELQKDNGTAVVIGVDSSAGGNHALRWAFDEARLRHIPLRAVHAWTYGHPGLGASGWSVFGTGQPAVVGAGEGRIAAKRMLEELIGDVAGEFPDVEVDVQIIDGGAAEVLVGVAAAGDLLVVGSRGHGGFAELLLGSVSQQCVNHARCPVVVVHPPKDTQPKKDAAHQQQAANDQDGATEGPVGASRAAPGTG